MATSQPSTELAASPSGPAPTMTTFQIHPVKLVLSEITSVASAMRKSARFSSSSSYFGYGSSSSNSSAFASYTPGLPSGSAKGGLASSMGLRNVKKPGRGQDEREVGGRTGSSVLLENFAVLRMQLRETDDMSNFDAFSLLQPFLEVIRSPSTSGLVTSTALVSMLKFLPPLPPAYPDTTAHGAIPFSPFLHPSSPSLSLALAALSHATTHCKFEASDSSSDEVVLLRILQVMEALMCGPLGNEWLSDESVCEMMETGLSMCCQMRLSGPLRRSAERVMHSMTRAVFTRLALFDPMDDQVALPMPGEGGPSTPAVSEAQITVSDSVELSIGAVDKAEAAEKSEEDMKGDEAEVTEEKDGEGANDMQEDAGIEAPPSQEAISTDPRPYGLASLKELLRVLISLLDPHDLHHTDSMRQVALSILCTAFEVGGRTIGMFAGLRRMIQDQACKHLFQLARSENHAVLSLALRCIAAMFDTMREHLKLQHELFLSFLIDRLAPSFPMVHEPWLAYFPPEEESSSPGAGEPSAGTTGGSGSTSSGKGGSLGPSASSASTTATSSSPASPSPIHAPTPPPPPPPPPLTRDSDRAPAEGETRELLLDALSIVSTTRSGPSEGEESTKRSDFLVDLWVNYDCDAECEDLFEQFVRFLCRGVFSTNPATGRQDNSQFLCLDSILGFIDHMTSRLPGAEDEWPSNYSTPAALRLSKSRKSILLEGAARFNAKPKAGLAFLKEQGLLVTEEGESEAESVARFLKTCPRLDKKLLGDYISRPDNVEVLKAFIGLFEFEDKPIAEAMRELLESFRLPGEAQQIARITEAFAEIYFASGPAGINSQDGVYVLAYSIIMLNTDLYNPQNRKRMTVEDYRRNLRGVNDGKDFAPEFLQEIYDSIQRREIVMPEEHRGQLGFEYAWKELMRRADNSGGLLTCQSSVFDRDLFQSAWKPIVASISYAFSNFQDDFMLERAIAGYRQCATLASAFGLSEVFDHIVSSLANVTGLLDDAARLSGSVNNPIVEVEGQAVTVSTTSVRFGMNFKGQLGAVVLFTIAKDNANAIQRGWNPVFAIFRVLYLASLLPPPFTQMEDFLLGPTPIPLKSKAEAANREERRYEGGLFSTLSSYLLSPYSSSNDNVVPEATDEDVENTLCAVDCVSSCRFDEIYEQILNLRGDALLSAVRALRKLADAQTVDRLLASGPGTGLRAPAAGQGASHQGTRGPLKYDPASVFLLELMVNLATRSGAAIVEVWPIIFEHISGILSSAHSFNLFVVERAVVGLLRVVLIAASKKELRDQIFLSLDLLRSLPAEALLAVSAQLMAGLSKILDAHAQHINSATEWNLVLALFGGTVRHPEAARISFDIVANLTRKDLTTGNFQGLVTILSDFASVADNTAYNRPTRDPIAQPKVDPAVRERGVKAIEMLFSMKSQVPRLIDSSSLPFAQSWETFWLPIMTALSHQCVNGCREVRQLALTHLQRTLVAPEVLSNPNVELTIVFERVLFPTLDELLKPHVLQRDPAGMVETRLRASTLLTKIFLHYLVQLSEKEDGMTELWLRILDFLDRFLNSGMREQMSEAISENIKNVLLVMHASGHLVPPPSPPSPATGAAEAQGRDSREGAQRRLWQTTFERIGKFLPDLRPEDLFPPPPPPPPRAKEVGVSEAPTLSDEGTERQPPESGGAASQDEQQGGGAEREP